MLVKAGIIARKIRALKTKSNTFLLAAGADLASAEQLAFLLPAALAACSGQIMKKSLKICIFAEKRLLLHFSKTLGINIKIAKRLFQLLA